MTAKYNYNKRWHQTLWSITRSVSARSSFLARGLEIVGNVSTYAQWQRKRGFDRAPSYLTREKMWTDLLGDLQNGPVTVLEFGVAGGNATRFLVGHLENPDLRWHGFDVFTGLPQVWSSGGVVREEVGAFDVGGKPPEIDDIRVTWHVGLVQDTLPGMRLDPTHRLFVIFDLDLYDPTVFALSWLADKFKPGDMMFFDEAIEPFHERKAIDEFVADGHRVKGIGTTGIALMVEYGGRDC